MSIISMALFSMYIAATQPPSTTEYDNSKTIYFKNGPIFLSEAPEKLKYGLFLAIQLK